MIDKNIKFNIIAQTYGGDKVKNFRESMSGIGRVTDGLESKLTKFAAGMFAVSKMASFASTAVNKFRDNINYASELDSLSQMTGIGASTLSSLREAASTADVSFEQLGKTLRDFSKRMGDPNAESFKNALKDLGIQSLDSNGKLRTTSDVVLAVSDKFKMLEDGPKKAALATELFGKKGAELIPMLNKGSKEIQSMGIKMGDQFPAMANKFNESLQEIQRNMRQTTTSFAEGFLSEFQTVLDSYNAIQKFSDKSADGSPFGKLGAVMAAQGYQIGQFFMNVADAGITAFDEIFSTVKSLLKEIWNVLFEITNSIVDITRGRFSSARQRMGNMVDNAGNGLAEAAIERRERWRPFVDRISERHSKAQSMMNLVRDGFSDNKPSTKGSDAAVTTGSNNALKREREALEKYILSQELTISKERLRLENISLTESELKKLTIAEELRSQSVQHTIGWQTEYKEKMAAATEEIIKQRQALIEMEQQQKSSFIVGAKRSFKEYLEGLKDVASQSQNLFKNMFTNMENALVNFVKTGKLSFRDLADAMIDDMIRIAVRQASLGLLTSLGFAMVSPGAGTANMGSGGYLGLNTSFSANGNVVTSKGPMPLSKFAKGGVVNSPHVAIFGEAGAEAFVPLPDGRRIPVALSMNGSGASGPPVTVNVYVEKGTTDVQGANMRELGTALGAAVRAEIVNQKRPGGLLA